MTNEAARKRVGKACDRCSRMRIRCNGETQCSSCTSYGYACQYTRILRRRGPKPRASSTSLNPGHRPRTVVDSSPRELASRNGRLDEPETPVSFELNQPLLDAVFSTQQDAARNDSTAGAQYPQAMSTFGSDTTVPASDTGFGSCSREPVLLYTCLQPVLALLSGVLDHDSASQLLLFYFRQPNISLFTSASPFVLTPILRSACLLDIEDPRTTSNVLLLTLLWVSAQTAQLPFLLIPRRRQETCDSLHALVIESLMQCAEPCLDVLLSMVLVAIVDSGGNRKEDSVMWVYKAVDMSDRLRLGRIDDPQHPFPSCKVNLEAHCSHAGAIEEAKEEGRRLFWLLFALDRHWALSFNRLPLILESGCEVWVPLCESTWNNSDRDFVPPTRTRQRGPGVDITGSGFFQFFLPLMAILGDVVWIHHQYSNHRLGQYLSPDAILQSDKLLEKCMETLNNWQDHEGAQNAIWYQSVGQTSSEHMTTVVMLYAKFIIHVLYVLLHGRWDALDLLSGQSEDFTAMSVTENPVLSSLSDWITSPHFQTCCSNAVAASEVVSEILHHDPELAFMPYLFGIYLLHGSFILLFFADRMLQVDGRPNESVEAACERTIRAHEVCVATLSVEFQKDFRKVLRRTLYNVRSRKQQSTNSPADAATQHGWMDDPGAVIARDVLGLYRWARGHRGLAV